MNYPDYVIELLQKAADNDEAEALFLLGVCYEASSPDKAEEFLRRACELNHTEAQRLLGKLLLKKGNQDEGVNLLAQIATNGDVSAQSILAEYYFDERKYEQALVWLKVAARNKDIRAYYLLSLCYGHGYGVKRDVRKAKDMWKNSQKILTTVTHNWQSFIVMAETESRRTTKKPLSISQTALRQGIT